MINPNELRLTNHILYKGLVMEVQMLVKGLDSRYEPIPLTDDIILKCEFMDEFNLSGFESDGYIAVINHSHIGNEMKYLHQLQNLYFALSGKEMRVKHV